MIDNTVENRTIASVLRLGRFPTSADLIHDTVVSFMSYVSGLGWGWSGDILFVVILFSYWLILEGDYILFRGLISSTEELAMGPCNFWSLLWKFDPFNNMDVICYWSRIYYFRFRLACHLANQYITFAHPSSHLLSFWFFFQANVTSLSLLFLTGDRRAFRSGTVAASPAEEQIPRAAGAEHVAAHHRCSVSCCSIFLLMIFVCKFSIIKTDPSILSSSA